MSATAVAGLDTTMPALRRPMNATKRPMPPAIAARKLGEIASARSRRTPKAVSARNATPERNTAPSAVRHGSGDPAAAAAGIAVSTKKKFSPMPGACAIG